MSLVMQLTYVSCEKTRDFCKSQSVALSFGYSSRTMCAGSISGRDVGEGKRKVKHIGKTLRF